MFTVPLLKREQSVQKERFPEILLIPKPLQGAFPNSSGPHMHNINLAEVFFDGIFILYLLQNAVGMRI